jgi:hypothetical protein
MARTGLAFLSLLALASCLAPSTTKKITTLGEIDMTDMVCRRAVPIGTSMPKTICARQADWAKYDERQIAASERMQDLLREQPNVGAFNRGH